MRLLGGTLDGEATVARRVAAVRATRCHSQVSAISTPDPAVEAAFAQVLQAEEAARAAVQAAHAQADEIAERARADARSRAERTRTRVAAVRAAFEAALQSELRGLAQQAEVLAVVTPLVTIDQEQVAHAVRQLAAQLTGGRR